MSGAATCPSENSGYDRQDVGTRNDTSSDLARRTRQRVLLFNNATALVNALSVALLALVSGLNAEKEPRVRTAPMGGGGSSCGPGCLAPMRPVILAPLGPHRWSEDLAKLGITVRYESPASSLCLHNWVNRSHEGDELPVSEDRRAIATAVGSCSDVGAGWT
jgi:hypothetical protein